MRLRTITGTRWPAKCADGCGTLIPPGPEVKVVVDFESHPRKTWIPEHSPDAGTWKGNGSTVSDASSRDASSLRRPNCPLSSAQPAPTNGSNGHSAGFTPANALPAAPSAPPAPPAPPKAPQPPPPLALLASTGGADATPNPASGVPWATASLTFNAGSFESARAGLADYAQPGETCEQLRARVNRLVLEDLERSVRAMRELHERLGDAPIRTSSPARAAGAPSGACSPPRMIVPSAPPTAEGASPGHSPSAVGAGPGPSKAPVPDLSSEARSSLGGATASSPSAQTSSGERPLKVLVHEVRLDLSDADPLRLSRKMRVWTDWLGKRGYSSANDVRPGDEWALERVLGDFEAVNRGGRA